MATSPLDRLEQQLCSEPPLLVHRLGHRGQLEELGHLVVVDADHRDVLRHPEPRLTDGVYDLVLLDADKADLEAYLEQALRLLRPGGVLAVDNALWKGKVADPAQRDEQTTAIREPGKAVRRDASLISALLPVGDGLLVAVKR